MFKKSGPGQAETDEKTMKPLIRNYFGEMLEKHRIKEATENLKALKLSEDDLVIIKGNKALVIPEKALKQVEEFGRMSLGLEKGVAHELDTKAVGEFINKNICTCLADLTEKWKFQLFPYLPGDQEWVKLKSCASGWPSLKG
jgi:hypothetical protein